MRSAPFQFPLRNRSPRTTADLTITVLQRKLGRQAMQRLVELARRDTGILESPVEDDCWEDRRISRQRGQGACALSLVTRLHSGAAIGRGDSMDGGGATSVRQVLSPTVVHDTFEVGATLFGCEHFYDHPLDDGQPEIAEALHGFGNEWSQVHIEQCAANGHGNLQGLRSRIVNALFLQVDMIIVGGSA